MMKHQFDKIITHIQGIVMIGFDNAQIITKIFDNRYGYFAIHNRVDVFYRRRKQ